MNTVPTIAVKEALAWCRSVLNPQGCAAVEAISDQSKEHGDHESATLRLVTPQGFCYLKIHQTRTHWNNEVHAYERWAQAFDRFAPRLLAVRDEAPLALLLSELPGQIVENAALTYSQAQAVWRAAGAALARLHALETGTCFGPCRRDGQCVEASTANAGEYLADKLTRQIEQAQNAGCLDTDELTTLQAAFKLIPAFDGERPIPCHRDYCAANWLVDGQNTWNGVIDFEFAHWDVRVADFSRDPNWNWIDHPDRWRAFFEGYGRPLTALEAQQLIVTHADYALGAILWGRAHAFYGFEREGRRALAHLAAFVR